MEEQQVKKSGKISTFLNSKIVKKDVGEETYLTWRETISYALGRGAQGMFTSMTGSKYLNYLNRHQNVQMNERSHHYPC